MPRLALANSFLPEYARLEKSVRREVDEAIDKFQSMDAVTLQSDPGLRLKKLGNARDPHVRTIRLGRFWRGVILAPDHGDRYCLLKVMAHDDAIAWATSRLFTVNTATAAVEMRNIVALEQMTPGLEYMAGKTQKRLLDTVSDADLARLGIDANVLRLARLVTTKAELEALGTLLPEDQYEVLFFLAEGNSVEDVWRDVVTVRRPPDVREIDPADLGAAMERSQGRIALVDGPDELMDILSRPLEAWRVFLHPSQHKTAYRASYAGPAQVSGGPGTGKTVVALHRVNHLAKSLGPGERILLTTYTNSLAENLRASLASLLEGDALQRVDVFTVDAFANRVLREHLGGGPLGIAHDEHKRWGTIIEAQQLPWSEPFLMQEYRHVILAQEASSLESYLKASRGGRGTPLGPVQRARVWRAVEEFTTNLRSANLRTYLQVCAEAAVLLNGRDASDKPYRHVVVDEAQDLHPSQWRVLRAAVAPGPDDLFIAGDPNQRIYDNRVSLLNLGIRVTGRSSRLRINYRTTEEILTWCTSLLSEQPVEDLGDGDAQVLGDCRSPLRGRAPILMGAANQDAELSALVRQVRRWVDDGVRPDEIGVAARAKRLGVKAAERLQAEGIPAVFPPGTPAADTLGVRIGTMHAMKGLEFRCMAVIGVGDGTVPHPAAITDASVDRLQHDADILAERCLLFVACTRAREALYVSWHGTPSMFLNTTR